MQNHPFSQLCVGGTAEGPSTPRRHSGHSSAQPCFQRTGGDFPLKEVPCPERGGRQPSRGQTPGKRVPGGYRWGHTRCSLALPPRGTASATLLGPQLCSSLLLTAALSLLSTAVNLEGLLICGPWSTAPVVAGAMSALTGAASPGVMAPALCTSSVLAVGDTCTSWKRGQSTFLLFPRLLEVLRTRDSPGVPRPTCDHLPMDLLGCGRLPLAEAPGPQVPPVPLPAGIRAPARPCQSSSLPPGLLGLWRHRVWCSSFTRPPRSRPRSASFPTGLGGCFSKNSSPSPQAFRPSRGPFLPMPCLPLLTPHSSPPSAQPPSRKASPPFGW